jgi:hypothetical protein
MTREEKYMERLMEQTYRVAQYGRRLSHGQLVESPHVMSLVAHYRELADLLELVLLDNGMDTSVDRLQLPTAAEAAREGKGTT